MERMHGSTPAFRSNTSCISGRQLLSANVDTATAIPRVILNRRSISSCCGLGIRFKLIARQTSVRQINPIVTANRVADLILNMAVRERLFEETTDKLNAFAWVASLDYFRNSTCRNIAFRRTN